MSDLITVQGVVLSAMPVGEYDKRIVLLTRERGKISAFAKGARRPNSPFLAAANPFVFGTFTLYEGRSSYNLNQVSITHHFVELAGKQPGIYYGYYFLELADYFGQEGTDVKALLNPHIDDRLVRCIFELRMMAVQGLCPSLFNCVCCGRQVQEEEEVFFSQSANGILDKECLGQVRDARRVSPAALYAMRYMVTAELGRLYTFAVKADVLFELERHIHTYISTNTEKRFKSLEILEIMS